MKYKDISFLLFLANVRFIPVVKGVESRNFGKDGRPTPARTKDFSAHLTLPGLKETYRSHRDALTPPPRQPKTENPVTFFLRDNLS